MPEPTIIFAGNTVIWTRTESDYPAPEWQLEYIAVSTDRQITFIATPDGTDHKVSLSATTTQEWEEGIYRWVANAKKGVEVFTVGTGQWEVFPNLELQRSGYDARSVAQKTVDALEEAYLQAISGHGVISSYSIGDTLFTFRTAEDIHVALERAKGILSREKDRERIAMGKVGRRSIKYVF